MMGYVVRITEKAYKFLLTFVYFGIKFWLD